MYLYEAFLGVVSSVALFRTCYCLRTSARSPCAGGASFRVDHKMGKLLINMKILKKVENFKSRWVYVDAQRASPLLVVPTNPAEKSPCWSIKS